jgi:CRISPR-associated protein Csd1
MLLQALHEYAQSRKLLADLPLQRRTLHALIDIDADGNLRQLYLRELTQPDMKGKESAGFDYLLPRFPGENNGGKAYFLAEGSVALFGRDKATGEPIPAPKKANSNEKDKNHTKAFLHFWDQIQAAFDTTNDSRLKAMLAFKREYLLENDGLIQCKLPFVRMRAKDKGKKQGELEFVASTGVNDGDYIVVEKSTIGFSVDGEPVSLVNENDPLREYWFQQFARQAFAEESEASEAEEDSTSRASLCLVTGDIGKPIARSHKPKILGVPGIAAGGYIVSFAKAAPAFSSYGFQMGENSPVSESAAAAYALALTELLRSEDSHTNLGPVAVCSWAKKSPKAASQFGRHLNKAYPEEVSKFLKAPFAGNANREVMHSDRLYTIALTGNAGRVVIQHWLSQSLDEAAKHFEQWWSDLQIAPIFSESASSAKAKIAKKIEATEQPPSPFAIPNLARASLRESKQQKPDKLVTERIVQLYRAALEGTAPTLMLLKPILDEFQSAFVKDDSKKPTYPFNQSRFALIKLILLRFFRNQPDRKEGDFMPTPQLADTPEPAYNLGRLLAVFESLQDRYHNFEKKGAGVVERFYGTASSAPAAVFPQLCRLARHHMSKVRKEDESAANRLDNQIGDILKKFQPTATGESPRFKRILTLPEQGIFALGFYQQRAKDRAAAKVLSNLGKARDLRKDKKPFDEPLTKARELANEFGYADLIASVNDFDAT